MVVTEELLVRLEESSSRALQRLEATRVEEQEIETRERTAQEMWRSLKSRISGTVR